MADSIKAVNYDQFAPTYDDRYKVNRLAGVENGILTCAQNIRATRVLEVGCGTGRWLSSMSSVLTGVFGLDLSPGMLAQAQKGNPNPHLTLGRAGDLPYANLSFDMVFCVNALHHFENPQGFIAGAWAVLKPNGCLVIIGQVPQDRRNHWYVYDYFDGTHEADLMRFHTWDTVKEWMNPIGFKEIHLSVVETIHDHKYGRDVLKDPFLRKNAVSQLAILSDLAYQQGIERIQEALEAADAVGRTLIFQTELRLDMLAGFKRTPER